MTQRWLLVTALLVAGICLLLGPIWLGLLLALWGFRLGWQQWPWLVAALAVGCVLGWHEQQLAAQPPVPSGLVRVHPTDWQFQDRFVRWTGVAENGVVVSGSSSIGAAEREQLQQIDCTALVAWSGQPTRLQGATNLYEFDYAHYRFQQAHQSFEIPTQALRWQIAPATNIVDWLYTLRVYLLRRIESLPIIISKYAKGLLLGQLDQEFAEMRQTFANLGILHLFSVSGLHIYALIGALYWLTDRLHVPKEWVDWASIGLLLPLLVLIPFGAGIIRAVWLRIAQILNQRLHLGLSTLDTLSLVLVLNCLIQPQVLFTLGGQLTYLLTFALVWWQQLPPLKLSMRLGILSWPVLLSQVFRLHLLASLFNLILMPIFELVLMPALLLVVSWPQANLVTLLVQGLTLMEQLLLRLEQLPGFVAIGALRPEFAIGFVIGYLLVVTYPGFKTRLLLATLLMLAIFDLNWRPDYRVSVFDVGQGDAILIEAPFKQGTVLIDTGGRGFGPPRANPPAKRVILNYLAARGITHLDALVLTHADADHVGDAGVITSGIRVDRLLTTMSGQHQPQIVPLLKQVRAVSLVQAGSRLQVGPLNLQVVAPDRPATDKNADSIVLYGKIGDSRWLFTGDADQAVEVNQLLPQKLAVDFLKAGHHGSKTSSAPAFIQQIHPKWALISAGRHNRYGHPHQETLQTLTAAHVPWLNTADSGMIWVDSGANTHRLNRMLNP